MFRGSFPRADVSLDPPLPEVAFVGPPDVMRRIGKVLRDTCYGAANAAERTA